MIFTVFEGELCFYFNKNASGAPLEDSFIDVKFPSLMVSSVYFFRFIFRFGCPVKLFSVFTDGASVGA